MYGELIAGPKQFITDIENATAQISQHWESSAEEVQTSSSCSPQRAAQRHLYGMSPSCRACFSMTINNNTGSRLSAAAA